MKPKVQIISSRYGTRVFLFTQFFDIKIFQKFQKLVNFTREKHMYF
jgi:hypothetical protein